MRLVTKTELVQLPVGTLYYEISKDDHISPMLECIDDLQEGAIWALSLNLPSPLSEATHEGDEAEIVLFNGGSVPLWLASARDVVYDSGERYLVYEKEDAEKLLAYLQEAITNAYLK